MNEPVVYFLANQLLVFEVSEDGQLRFSSWFWERVCK